MERLIKSSKEIQDELGELTALIEEVEFVIDYGGRPMEEEYLEYQSAIERRDQLTKMLDNPEDEIKMQ